MSIVARFRFDFTTNSDRQHISISAFLCVSVALLPKTNGTKAKKNGTTHRIWRFCFRMLFSTSYLFLLIEKKFFVVHPIVTQNMFHNSDQVFIYGQFSTLFYGAISEFFSYIFFTYTYSDTCSTITNDSTAYIIYLYIYRIFPHTPFLSIAFRHFQYPIRLESEKGNGKGECERHVCIKVDTFMLCIMFLWLLIYIISLNNIGYTHSHTHITFFHIYIEESRYGK